MEDVFILLTKWIGVPLLIMICAALMLCVIWCCVTIIGVIGDEIRNIRSDETD